MRAVLLYLFVVMAYAMLKETNCMPGFFEALIKHCPLMNMMYPEDDCCCCDHDDSCCSTDTTTDST